MPTPAHLDAAAAYWKATGGGAALPALPDNPADAVAALFRARALSTWACAFSGVELDDPWPSLALAEGDTTEAEVRWALGVADLAPVGTGHDGSWLVVDRCPDPRGEHRAFFVTRRGEVIGPWFSSTTSLLEWAAALAEDTSGDGDPDELDREPPPRDIWNRSTLSGVGALVAWRQFSPALFYRAVVTRQWPDIGLDPGACRVGDPTRTNLLRTLGRFARSRTLSLPAAVPEAALSAPQRTHVERMRELAAAMDAGEVPPFVSACARTATPLSDAARAWIARFESAAPRAPAPKPARGAKAAAPVDDSVRAALTAVAACVKVLADEGAIEIAPKRRAELAEEILAAMMKAGSSERAVRAAVTVVTESPLVEEVYADDKQLERALRVALGR